MGGIMLEDNGRLDSRRKAARVVDKLLMNVDNNDDGGISELAGAGDGNSGKVVVSPTPAFPSIKTSWRNVLRTLTGLLRATTGLLLWERPTASAILSVVIFDRLTGQVPVVSYYFLTFSGVNAL